VDSQRPSPTYGPGFFRLNGAAAVAGIVAAIIWLPGGFENDFAMVALFVAALGFGHDWWWWDRQARIARQIRRRHLALLRRQYRRPL
jgi:hypothetical protein